MAKIAFGRQHYEAANPLFDAVARTLRELPRRFRSCHVEIVMRGSSAAYEEWIVLEVSRTSDANAESCIAWVSKEITRQGFVIVPMDRL